MLCYRNNCARFLFARDLIFISFSILLCLFGFLFCLRRIPLEEELKKEQEVASIHDKGSNVVLSLDIALASIRVGHDKAQDCNRDSDNHLRNLRDSNVHAVEPLGFALDGHQEIVKVHDGMDSVVHDAKDNSGGCLGDIAVPAVGQNGDVMVPVQKDERLFVNENEKCVDQLTAFSCDRMAIRMAITNEK